MIEVFVSVTILMVLIAATILTLLQAPWWASVLVGSLLIVAINRLMHPPRDDEEAE